MSAFLPLILAPAGQVAVAWILAIVLIALIVFDICIWIMIKQNRQKLMAGNNKKPVLLLTAGGGDSAAQANTVKQTATAEKPASQSTTANSQPQFKTKGIKQQPQASTANLNKFKSFVTGKVISDMEANSRASSTPRSAPADTSIYDVSFEAKLAQAEDSVKKYYGTVKNEILSYKGTTSKVEWGGDVIKGNGKVICKIVINNKALCLCLSLKAEQYAGTKYKLKEIKSAKAKVSVFKVKTSDDLKSASKLIADVAYKYNLKRGQTQNKDYNVAYKSTEELLSSGLIKKKR